VELITYDMQIEKRNIYRYIKRAGEDGLVIHKVRANGGLYAIWLDKASKPLLLRILDNADETQNTPATATGAEPAEG